MAYASEKTMLVVEDEPDVRNFLSAAEKQTIVDMLQNADVQTLQKIRAILKTK